MFGNMKFSRKERELKISTSLQYFSIHIGLKLLRELTLLQYDCSPPSTASKLLAIFMNNSVVEQVESLAVFLSLYGFLWSFFCIQR